MKRFIFKLLILIILLFCVDRMAALVFQYLLTHPKGGDTARLEFIAKQMNDDVIIFGSSRAMHHYDPIILEDSLGMPVYNCGRDGNGIIYSYGQFNLFKKRYTPKVIIYDIEPLFDLRITNESNEKYIGDLRPYYNYVGIDSIFHNVSATERFKMLPYMRWYNNFFIQFISDYLRPLQSDIKGYKPHDKVMEYEPVESNKPKSEIIYDPLKLYYWQRLIEDTKANGTKLILTVSPIYHGGDIEAFSPLIELADKNGIPFVNYYNDSTIINNRLYFKDQSHLNKDGAEAFTKEISRDLKHLLPQKEN